MIYEKLCRLIAEQFSVDIDDLTADTSFVDDFNADSIDIVELMMAVEEEFNLGEVEESSLEGLRTIGDVVNYIKDRT